MRRSSSGKVLLGAAVLVLPGLLLIPGGGDGTATATTATVSTERPPLARALDATLKQPVVTTASFSPGAEEIDPTVTGSVKTAAVESVTPAPVLEAALPATVTKAVDVKTPLERTRVARSVNVRSGPGTENSRLDTLKAGEGVDVLAKQDGWVHIRMANGAEGWVFGEYLGEKARSVKVAKASRREVASVRSDDDEDRVVERKKKRAEVSRVSSKMGRVSRKTTLFSRPDRAAGRVGTVRAGERIRVLGTDGGWAKIQTSDGETGWVAL